MGNRDDYLESILIQAEKRYIEYMEDKSRNSPVSWTESIDVETRETAVKQAFIEGYQIGREDEETEKDNFE